MNKIVAFDLDDVLCYRDTKKNGIEKYNFCKPNLEMIKIVNECYDNGMYIKIYTARGMSTFSGNIHDVYSNLYELTKNQLRDWQIKHHELIMGKIHYDIFIDDKVHNSSEIKNYNDIVERLFK